jgi:hypothetical protein
MTTSGVVFFAAFFARGEGVAFLVVDINLDVKAIGFVVKAEVAHKGFFAFFVATAPQAHEEA